MSTPADKEKLSPFQSPFRQKRLLTADRFVDYCKNNGAYISIKNLERLHREKLLFPAAKVYRGVVEFKKIYADFKGKKEWRFVHPRDTKALKPTKAEKRKYYASGSILMGRDNWLDWYEEKKMVEYPASRKFQPWNKRKHESMFITNYQSIEKYCEFFYEKSQMLAVRIINRRIRLWKFFTENQKEKDRRWIREKIADLYNFLQIYIEIEQEYENWQRFKLLTMRGYRNQKLNERQGKQEWATELEFSIKTLREQAEKILEKHKSNTDYIKEWRQWIARQNIFHESGRSSSCIRNYLKGMDEYSLIDAEDTNYMVFIINTFFFCLEGREISVKQIISETGYPQCVICGELFSRKRKGQVTCGNPYCINENKNQMKRKNRRKP